MNYKILRAIYITAFVIVFLIIWGFQINPNYNRNAIVARIDKNQMVTARDRLGTLWYFKNKNFKINDKIIIYLNNNNTPVNFLDDEIINVKLARGP